MHKLFWLVSVVLVVALGVTAMSVLVAHSEYTYPHPSGAKLIVSDGGGAVPEVVLRQRERLEAAEQLARFPRAVAADREFDFGVMNPLTMGKHTFVVRNEGDGPLQLRKGGTTCKCTLSSVSGGLVQPGEQGEVTLSWNTGRHLTYSHGATILTNDPDNPRLEFRVKGTVRIRIGATRESLLFSRLNPDETAVVETVVYSQIYNEMALQEVTCSLEDATWDIEPADEETLEKLKATAGYVVRVTSPRRAPSGPFHGVLNLAFNIPAEDPAPGGQPAGDNPDDKDPADDQQRQAAEAEGEVQEEDAQERYTLQIAGTVTRRLSVYGEDINAEGIVYFDVVDQGKGRRIRLLMKVRDEERELSVKRVDVRPEFVQVSVTPFGGDEQRGLYYLDLEVPEDAPACRHIDPSRQGALRMEFDHPRITDLELKLRLAVAPGGI